MKIGIMGGTFDPIHIGHMIAAEEAFSQLKLDEVWFVPVHMPPHKIKSDGASNEHRLKMLQLAIEDRLEFRLNVTELERGGVSYSIDTVKQFQAEYAAEFYYIIGGDMVHYLPHWHKIDELAQLIYFIGLNRGERSLNLSDLPEYISKRVIPIQMPQVDISSTLLRERLKRGQSVRYLVPEQVRRYMIEEQVYGV